ncbi:MAG: hypothetical protein JWM82_484, partial [Myxococcales bacterium]|nr:hypothetical protein [Myxococcales bacterium]
MRKPRLNDAERRAKAARPAGRGRLPRVVKAKGAKLPRPANDTVPPDLELADPAILDEAVLGNETGGETGKEIVVAEAEAELEPETAEADGAEAETEEASEDEEVAEEAAAPTKRSRSDDEPASFLAMYFRDMAELDVLRPEQEFETARQIEELEHDLWKTVLG